DELGPTDAVVVGTRLTRGWNRLRFGDLDGAIADFTVAEALADATVPELRGRARELLGAAWIRKAETDNCITNGSGEACIVPFDDAAVHADPTGMANAAAAFERRLTEDLPDRISVRWLLNVTYMARGDWPDGVPEPFRFPDTFLATEGDAAAWTNHVPALGPVKAATLAGGSAIDDFDGDGLLDLMLSTMGPEAGMSLFLNQGDGTFCDGSDASGVSSIPSILSFQAADFDNDGDLDVFAPRGAWHGSMGRVRPSFLVNDGTGHFADRAIAAGLADPAVDGPSQVGVWADFDDDGLLDLFVGRESHDGADPDHDQPSSLYRNLGDGTFVDLAPELGLAASGFVKGASALDLENDGDLDLFVSSLEGPDHLYVNEGPAGELAFVDRAAELGTLAPVKSFASAVLDYDQDGRDDLFVAAFTSSYGGGRPLDPNYFRSSESFVNDLLGLPTDPAYSETAHLYRNTGGAFEDVTVAVGLDDIHATMGLSTGDLDLDGFPDLYLATGAPEYDALEPNTSYRNDGGARFLDVTTASRLGHLQKGHGVSFGDVDEDGDEDLLVDIGGAFVGDPAPPALWSNPSNQDGQPVLHAVTLRLEGVTEEAERLLLQAQKRLPRDARPAAELCAIGARVEVVHGGGRWFGVVGRTGSFGGNSHPLEVALGVDPAIDRIEITWPGGGSETVDGVEADQVVVIRQGDGVVSATPYRRLALAGVH
ncbi:MAG: CRTAC1 family protein, partial [Myxococcota bacterium]